LGLALTVRLAPAFIIRQLIWLVIATTLLLAVTLIPSNLNWFRRFKYAWLSGGLLLLATTLFLGVNPSGFGARLWLQFGSIYFQPSEPLKLFLIVFLAAYLADRRRQLVEINAYFRPLPVPFPHPSYFGPMFIMWAISIILLIWQRDLGAALLFFSTFVGMLYAATGQRRYVWAGVLLLIAAGVLGYYLFDVVRLRVESFWNPWQDPAGRSFQIVQSLLAFASGGFLGQGLGQGLPTAIPVVHTDFVFAAIGEEYGLIGTVGVLTCFALLVNRAFHIGLQAKRGFEQLLAVGIGLMFGLQTVVIMAGTLKLMPLTGVTLPFVSYGGSSLVTSFLMVGVLMFISRRPTTGEPAFSPVPLPDPGPYLHLMRGFFVAFSIIAGGLIFWQIALAPLLVARTDNPRPIITEQTSRRGRLLTADGVPIAETVFNRDGLAERRYPYPGLASVTGYYSLRYGVGGTEATFDAVLRGLQGRTAQEVWLDQLLHRPLVGQDVTVTINLPAQVAADVALGNREGGVVIMDLHSGAILVMSSQPTYDPNLLDETWDDLRDAETAPLLNRATQGLFPVGDLARLIGLIGLYEAKIRVPPDPATAPLETMLGPLGESGYLATAHQLGLTGSIAGVRSQPGLLP
ncbi:MAG: FtsW/RodA/SpoVE family cell cycle protein, partial [Anaerolineae bacterium]|nr:FtsW/RodA/SpoVE family cell cycle protein [Anaerolineae bacterium]